MFGLLLWNLLSKIKWSHWESDKNLHCEEGWDIIIVNVLCMSHWAAVGRFKGLSCSSCNLSLFSWTATWGIVEHRGPFDSEMEQRALWCSQQKSSGHCSNSSTSCRQRFKLRWSWRFMSFSEFFCQHHGYLTAKMWFQASHSHKTLPDCVKGKKKKKGNLSMCLAFHLWSHFGGDVELVVGMFSLSFCQQVEETKSGYLLISAYLTV